MPGNRSNTLIHISEAIDAYLAELADLTQKELESDA